MIRKIVIAGANGFLGRYLSRYFLAKGWLVIAIARKRSGLADGVNFHPWDGHSMSGEASGWERQLEGAEVLVNLAGKSVNCRYNKENREAIFASRLKSTYVLGQAVAQCARPPKVWINSSTATIYRHAEDRPQTERDGEIGSGFSVEVAKAWEKAFFEAEVPESVRKVALRTAMVMGDEPETVWDVLGCLAKLRLGGKMGNGRQMVSWIHVEDFCRVVDWCVERPTAEGVYNVSSPNPVTNTQLMQLVRHAHGVKYGLPASKWMLELGAFLMKTETELVLKSRWVLPQRLLEEGFSFQTESLHSLQE